MSESDQMSGFTRAVFEAAKAAMSAAAANYAKVRGPETAKTIITNQYSNETPEPRISTCFYSKE